MCIIIYKPKGKRLKKEILEECHRCNKDGMGYMYPMDGKVHIEKELTDFKKFYKAYEQKFVKTNLDLKVPIVWHFRIKTHGDISLENCHPFHINGSTDMAFAHNGYISNVDTPTGSIKSDTVIFRDLILNNMPKKWFNNKALVLLLTKFINTNKLAFLDKFGNVNILNKDLGQEDKDGIWYSNGSYKIVEYNNKPNNWNHNRWADADNEYYDEDINLPSHVVNALVSRIGWNKGLIWDTKVTRYVKPSDHSNPAVVEEARKIPAFNKYDDRLNNKSMLLIKPKPTPSISTYATMKLREFIKVPAYELRSVDNFTEFKPKRNTDIQDLFDKVVICQDCTIPIHRDDERKRRQCTMCMTIAEKELKEMVIGNVKH